jgi:hypothetical protein
VHRFDAPAARGAPRRRGPIDEATHSEAALAQDAGARAGLATLECPVLQRRDLEIEQSDP